MPRLDEQLVTNARLVDGGAKVTLDIFVFSLFNISIFVTIILVMIIIITITTNLVKIYHSILCLLLQVPFLSAAVWRDGETLEEDLMEAVMTDKVEFIITIALCIKSNWSYVLKDFGTLPLIFSTSKYSRWKFQPCPSF